MLVLYYNYYKNTSKIIKEYAQRWGRGNRKIRRGSLPVLRNKWYNILNMTAMISNPVEIGLEIANLRHLPPKDPIRLGLLGLSSNIADVLGVYPDAQEIALVDNMPECRTEGWDALGYRQRLPLPEGSGLHLTSQFVREGNGGVVRGNILLPSINRQDMTTYVLNEAVVVGLEIREEELPRFVLSGITASRRFFSDEDSKPRIAKRDSEPDRYLRELNAALEFVLRERSGCGYIPSLHK
jgi:hypothetical protein